MAITAGSAAEGRDGGGTIAKSLYPDSQVEKLGEQDWAWHKLFETSKPISVTPFLNLQEQFHSLRIKKTYKVWEPFSFKISNIDGNNCCPCKNRPCRGTMPWEDEGRRGGESTEAGECQRWLASHQYP